MGNQVRSVLQGSVQSRSAVYAGFRITDARFPPFLYVPPHRHRTASFGVVVEGSLEVLFDRTDRVCHPGTCGAEPIDDLHANRVGEGGARVIGFEIDPNRLPDLGPGAHFIEAGSSYSHPSATQLALRASDELGVGDGASPLVIESALLELLALSIRLDVDSLSIRDAPHWLRRARAVIEARYLETVRTDEIASEVGIHPVHLARTFRRFVGVSVGTYVRRLRLDWARRELLASDDPISRISADAGFSDQSHFSRCFREMYLVSPAKYRHATRSERASVEREGRPRTSSRLDCDRPGV